MIELDRHIEILLLSNDCVIIPGFGGFMAHYMEARKDERDHAFLPPMRTIGFNPKLTLNDSLLAQSYVEAYDISYPDAVSRIADEVRELRQHLEHDGLYELNDIGKLYLNKEGNYEFMPCDAGILTPSLYGLGYFHYQTIKEIEQKNLEQASASVVSIPTRSKVEAQQDSQVVELDYLEDEPEERSGIVKLWKTVAVASVAFIVFLLIPAPLANNSKVLQSRLDTKLLEYIMPKDVTTGEAKVKKVVESVASRPVSEVNKETANLHSNIQSGYTIVLASKITKRNATAYVHELQSRGYDDTEVLVRPTNIRVILGQFKTQQEANQLIRKLHKDPEFEQAWIMKY